MKKLLFILLLIPILLTSCSNDDSDCEAEKAAILEQYAIEVELTTNSENLSQEAIDKKLEALRIEKDRRIAEACGQKLNLELGTCFYNSNFPSLG